VTIPVAHAVKDNNFATTLIPFFFFFAFPIAEKIIPE
jgi:hypothetical protein